MGTSLEVTRPEGGGDDGTRVVYADVWATAAGDRVSAEEEA